jgi:hypothetical protein
MCKFWLSASVGIKGRYAVNPLTPPKASAGRITREAGAWIHLTELFVYPYPRSGYRRAVLNTKTVLWFSRFPRRKQEHLARKIQGFGLVDLFLLCRPK